ncbi:MAG: double zinc ribbon domain-containing protein, partial [Planctomycetota bacterium]
MATKIFCRHCGKANPNTLETCSDCGKTLRKGGTTKKEAPEALPPPKGLSRGTGFHYGAKGEVQASGGGQDRPTSVNILCPDCGRLNKGSNRFCNGCGKPLEGVAPTAEVKAPGRDTSMLTRQFEEAPPDPASLPPAPTESLVPDWMSAPDPGAPPPPDPASLPPIEQVAPAPVLEPEPPVLPDPVLEPSPAPPPPPPLPAPEPERIEPPAALRPEPAPIPPPPPL